MSQRFQGSFHLALRKVSRLRATIAVPIPKEIRFSSLIGRRMRNDQLIVQEDRDEASCRVMFCIDTSSTVFWPEQKTLHNEPQKWEVICRIALHLAYVHLKLGDTVHFYF